MDTINTGALKSPVIMMLLSTCVLQHTVLGGEVYYPEMVNAVLQRPVSVSPVNATCGLSGPSGYCVSQIAGTPDCSQYGQTCDSSCPYGEKTPQPFARVLDKVTVAVDANACVGKDTVNIVPIGPAEGGFSIHYRGSGQGTCVLMVPKFDLIQYFTLNSMWDLTFSMWIKPELQTGEIGSIFQVLDKNNLNVLHIYMEERRVRFSSSSAVTPSSWTLSLGEWQHISLQIYNNSASFFVDGNFLYPAIYDLENTLSSPQVADSYRLGESLTGERFRGYIQDFRIYPESLTNREVLSVSRGVFPAVSGPQPECRCPPQAPRVRDTDPTYCVPNDGRNRPQISVFRLNARAHPPELVSDGKLDTKWISRLDLQNVNLTFDLQDVYEVRNISIRFYSALPRVLIIHRRHNSSMPWEHWRLYARDCATDTGYTADRPLASETDVQCSPLVPPGSDPPYSQGLVTFDLLAGRPGNPSGGLMTLALREFLQAGQVQLELKGGQPDATGPTLRYHGVFEVDVSAFCNCHGHGRVCVHAPGQPYVCTCAPESYTKGRRCTECVTGTYRDPALNEYHPDVCRPCNCDAAGTQPGAGSTCNAVGGQCQCKAHVTGRSCDTCKDGYYRLSADNSNGCRPCTCDTRGTIGGSTVCDKATGQCPCKENVQGMSCSACSQGHYDLSAANPAGCADCACSESGVTTQGECDPSSGQCPCKQYVTGRMCEVCDVGYYLLEYINAEGCQACGCDPDGAQGVTCHQTLGTCTCKLHVAGDKCSVCEAGYYALNTNDLRNNGCSHICGCSLLGVVSNDITCDISTGQCHCLPNVAGDKCDRCKAGTYGYGTDSQLGCKDCLCDEAGSLSSSCNVTTGQCQCKRRTASSRRCDTCDIGHFNLTKGNLDGCEPCDCYLPASTGVCNAASGQCMCQEGAGDPQLSDSHCHPYVSSIAPLFGPRSGGTRVTVTGGYLDNATVTVTLGDKTDVNCQVDTSASSARAVVCTTSNINLTSAVLDTPLTAAVTHGDFMVIKEEDQSWSFTYRRDPVITMIEPRASIVSGGIPLTVTGEFLDSVSSPYLVVTTTWKDDHNTTGGKQGQQFVTLCTVSSGTTMVCPSPNISLDTSMLPSGRGQLNNDQLHFFIGFRLDGVTAYERLDLILPELSELIIYIDPEFTEFTPETLVFRPYWPYQDSVLTVQGDRLTQGVTSKHYMITVGEEDCTNIIVTDSNAKCFPPESRPLGVDPKLEPRVIVSVGNIRFSPGYLRYEENFWQNDAFLYGVIGASVGAFLVIVIIIIICCCCCCCRNKNKDVSMKHSHPFDNLGGKQAGTMDRPFVKEPDFEYNTNTPPAKTISRDTTGSGYTTPRTAPATYVNQAAAMDSLLELIPSDLHAQLKTCSIDKKRIYLGKVIAQGSFGLVYLGRLTDQHSDQQTPVLIKTRDLDRSSKEDYISLLREGLLLKDYNHENVHNPIGAIVDKSRSLLVLPNMENGDLRGFISNDENVLTVGELINFSLQIATGMSYLSEHRFIHRDLACRNCMISKELVVRVSDSALAGDLHAADYVELSPPAPGPAPVPARWLAPETLHRGLYTTKTDIWSYGVCLWELLTRGCCPYPDVDDARRMPAYIAAGNRMDRPDYAPTEMYQLIVSCWDADPRRRPSFVECKQHIINFLEVQNAKTNLRRRQRQQVPPTQRGRAPGAPPPRPYINKHIDEVF